MIETENPELWHFICFRERPFDVKESQNTQRILAAFEARKWIWQRDQTKSEKNNPGGPQKRLVCLVGDGR